MEEKFFKYVLIVIFAFIAELIDGGIGMGYGVSLTTFLLSIGIGTAVASATVHISEIFTTFFSGMSHFKFGNFDKKIFTYLLIPGIVGGILGSYLSVKLQDISFIKPFISGILLVLGVLIIIKYIKNKEYTIYSTPRIRKIVPIGFIAAFVDAIGGGGWGPIATPSLIASNSNPKKTIGSVNFAEFFVTLAISITFLIMLPEINWSIVLFMIIGGIIAAPIAAMITKRLPLRTVGISVGCLIIILSLRTILNSIGV